MSNPLSKTRQTGFTLVELVIVILILGILSAVALPRFVNLGVDARKAKAEGIFGAVRSATQIVRAGALIRGATGATGTVAVDGATINTVYGFPAASLTGIVAAAGLNSSDDKVTVAVAGTPPVVTITVDGAATPANCSISYTEATATDAPVITNSVTAC